jgi:hypothetical protein
MASNKEGLVMKFHAYVEPCNRITVFPWCFNAGSVRTLLSTNGSQGHVPILA